MTQAKQPPAKPARFKGDVAVTLETELDHLDRDLLSHLRTLERMIDLTAGETRMA